MGSGGDGGGRRTGGAAASGHEIEPDLARKLQRIKEAKKRNGVLLMKLGNEIDLRRYLYMINRRQRSFVWYLKRSKEQLWF